MTSTATSDREHRETALDVGGARAFVRPVPRGRRRLGWYGPALLWMVSAVGSGSVLFTPRVAARYQYQLLWVAVVTCAFMWIMIREAARYTTVSGRTLLDGFRDLPGPRGWALWVIFVPQVLAAVVGVAGLCALVGSALHVALGGPHQLYTLGTLAIGALLVALGQYDVVERVSRVMAAVLIGLSAAAATQVLDGVGDLAGGLRPQVPTDLDLAFVLPWIGTILAGSMGIIWFAYWTGTHGYGGPTSLSAEHRDEPDEPVADDGDGDRRHRLQDWMRLVSRASLLAVAAGGAVIVAFNVLGAELLAPEGRIPEGVDVARDLAGLMEGVWGPFGFWALIVLTVFALGGSVIANQDGWSRSFADISVLLLGRARPGWATRRRLKRGYVVVVTGALPAAVFVVVQDPVAIMTASGVVAAVHTPFIAALILLVNRRHLPDGLRPGPASVALLGLAGLFYLALAAARVLA